MLDTTTLLVRALRVTARRLADPRTPYQWAHFGRCNCGHLAQTLTRLAPEALQRAAERHEGDWSEQAHRWQKTAAENADPPHLIVADYGDRPALDEGAWEPLGKERCPSTDLVMTEVFQHLRHAGLTADDLVHLERLSDPRVRRRMGTNTVDFHYSERNNVVRYLDAWAALPESETQEQCLTTMSESYFLAAE